jgi:hypothetical protein
MAGPWFKAEPVDATFFETAPMRLRGKFAIPRPAAEVWAELTEDDTLSWCRILQSVTWTSPRPFGVGTTREARALGGANILKEEFFRWEEGRQKSFFVLESTSPMFRRFAEDYLVEPRGETSCRFVWTIAAEPKPAALLLTPGNKLILKTLFTDTAKHYGLHG